jgi:hypothetical protein
VVKRYQAKALALQSGIFGYDVGMVGEVCTCTRVGRLGGFCLSHGS